MYQSLIDDLQPLLQPNIPTPPPPPPSPPPPPPSSSKEQDLIHLLSLAQFHIHELETTNKINQVNLDHALKELKKAAHREEILMQQLSEIDKEQNWRGIVAEQHKQQRINLALMRTLENICEKTQQETAHNNQLRVQMIQALDREHQSTKTHVLLQAQSEEALKQKMWVRETIEPKPYATSTKADQDKEGVKYTIFVPVQTSNGLGCAFDQEWNIKRFANPDTSSRSSVEQAGALIGDQLIAINDLYFSTDWPSRSSIIEYLNQSRTQNRAIELTLKRTRPSATNTVDSGNAVTAAVNVVPVPAVIKQEQVIIDPAVIEEKPLHEKPLHVSPILTPAMPHRLFVSTPTGKWR